MSRTNAWTTIFGWYETGDFVQQQLHQLKQGHAKEQLKALHSITKEVEHQGSLSYLAPFAVQELICILKEGQTVVPKEIVTYLEALRQLIADYFTLLKDNYTHKRYLLQDLLCFFKKHPDQAGKNSIYETEDSEGLIMVYALTQQLILAYFRGNGINN